MVNPKSVRQQLSYEMSRVQVGGGRGASIGRFDFKFGAKSDNIQCKSMPGVAYYFLTALLGPPGRRMAMFAPHEVIRHLKRLVSSKQ